MLETLLDKPTDAERCGLILDGDTVVEIDNVADNPSESFMMDPVQVLPHLTKGNVTGTWHTHPHSDPTLSGDDYAGFSGWPDLKHHIIGRRGGKVVVEIYEIKDGAILKCA